MYGGLGGVVGVEVSMHYKYTALVKASYIHVWWLGWSGWGRGKHALQVYSLGQG